MLTHVFLMLVGSKTNSFSDNPLKPWMVFVDTSWIENWIFIYVKWLGFTNYYIFDDRFNWCPFLFNVVVIIMIIFFSF
jgi:hypothetical protein